MKLMEKLQLVLLEDIELLYRKTSSQGEEIWLKRYIISRLKPLFGFFFCRGFNVMETTHEFIIKEFSSH